MNQILTHAPYAAGSDTSLAAAIEIDGHLDRLEAKVLAVIRDHDDRGLTCDEVEDLTGLSHQTASARIHALAHKKHLIHPTNLVRKTRSGRAATVWLANLT